MGGLQMSQKQKYRNYNTRPINPEDDDLFCPESLLQSVVDFDGMPSTIDGSTCEAVVKDGESFEDVSIRISELFFHRTELISRALSGSYVISHEEALEDLQKQYNASKDETLKKLLNFPWSSLNVRFRKMISRSRAKIPAVTQAEICISSGTGVYYYYFNFIPCDFHYPSFTRYSYVVALEPGSSPDTIQAYFALTCPSNDDSTVLTFTNNMAKGLSHWITSGKKADANPPLSCVPNTYYTILEEVRKHAIVQDLSDKWSSYERTNKAKHLFEDVGIVAYLATYWSSNSQTSIRFVDIGCGNGVISYLLNGLYGDSIKGIGYDVKARKIWDYYKAQGIDALQIQAIIPTISRPEAEPKYEIADQPFSNDTNYIIGIHTDEMTPWIPIFAMKQRCNFFILPCCPFDFFGRYSKRQSKPENNNEWEYFNYIVNLAKTLGFEVKVDTLKIPSEKKTAIIGTIPSSGQLLPDFDPDWHDTLTNLMAASYKANNRKGFLPRTSEIAVKNCSQLPLEVRDAINQSIVQIIHNLSNSESGVSFCQILSGLSKEHINYLKSQSGGLQTFIKNHRQGYTLNQGKVYLRTTPYCQLPKTSNVRCFFEQFYGHDCQHRDSCGYRHLKEEF